MFSIRNSGVAVIPNLSFAGGAFSGFRADSLQYAILIATFAYFWAGAHFLMAGRSIRQELDARVEGEVVANWR